MTETLTTRECRKLLGDLANGWSDQELATLRDDIYALSLLIVDAYESVEETIADLDLGDQFASNAITRTLLRFDEFEAEDLEEIDALSDLGDEQSHDFRQSRQQTNREASER